MAKRQTLNLNSLIPSALKNDTLTSLVSNVFNRFVSEERSISIEGRIGRPVDGDANIKASSLDHELNALVPAFYYKVGTEEFSFTFSDLINRFKSIGVDMLTMKNWLKEQSFNYTLPIDYDKFINYTSYYWVAEDIKLDGPLVLSDMSSNPSVEPEYYVIAKGTNVNIWTEYNFWVHIDDLANLGYNIDNCVRANRPIIEYSNTLQLNNSVINGNPNANINNYAQIKNRINHIPQFDLFRYDGTYAGSTSGIFYYAEDPDFTTDAVLKRRVKTTVNSDYVFGVGLVDSAGRLLYYKENQELKTVWQAGTPNPIAIQVTQSGTDGTLSITQLSAAADNQDWVFTAIDANTFSAYGSRSGNVGNVAVNVEFVCDDLSVIIAPGTLPFKAGDIFSFSIAAPLTPRYVKKLADGSIVNYAGGVPADLADGGIDGTWLTPLRMFQNVERETRTEIAFGDLLNHFRSVLRNQDGFEGTSFGRNNSRTLVIDKGLGGTIRDFASNFPLLASMILQKDFSPITFIDFAEQQQNIALSSIDQFLADDLPEFFAYNQSIVLNQIDPNNPDIQNLLTYFENTRQQNTNLSSVFYDTTASVKNWPASLPMLGLAPKYLPTIELESELGLYVIVHHDGHKTPVIPRDAELDRNLVKSVVKRSDGTSSPGIFSEAVPITPYARQLWIKPSTFQLYIFDVIADTDTCRSGTTGEYWYKKSDNTLYEWDATGNHWIISADSVSSRWKYFDTSSIRNSFVLAVENKLYAGVHQAQQINYDIFNAVGSQYSEVELAKYSLKYGYDTYAPNYVASDAFSWNYKQATLIGMPSVPAKWFDIYKQYFATFTGTLPTSSPHTEPWKLGTTAFPASATKPAGWDSMYAAPELAITTVLSAVTTIATSNVANFVGLQTINGYALNNGDRVAVVGQTLPQLNGVYIVSVGGWVRASDVISSAAAFDVVNGNYANTTWVVTTTGTIVNNVTPLSIQQFRSWKMQMWLDIKAAKPVTFKLCVNTFNDSLLPPYVSSSIGASSEALFTTIPSGTDLGYAFGDNGPVESVWKRSVEYIYGLVRSSFKFDPLYFLDKAWGETYYYFDKNTRVERNTLIPLPSSKFLVHGARLNVVNSYTPTEVAEKIKILGSISYSGAARLDFKVSHCADNKTYFDVILNGNKIAVVLGGSLFSLSAGGVTMVDIIIDDQGIPFEINETLSINFFDDIVDPDYVPTTEDELALGCEGCVSEETVIVQVPMVPVSFTYAHTAATVKVFKGLGQVFTHFLRYSYIDTDVSPATIAYNRWTVRLCHRLGALIKPDSLVINSDYGILPETAFDIILKRSTHTSDKWISGLRVQLVSMGKRKLNNFGFMVPTSDGSDWTFRIEGYNNQHPEIEYHVLDTSASYQTFFALQKQRTDLEWKRYTENVAGNYIQTMVLPATVTGIQNVVNIIYGYVDRLESIGWKLDSDDTPTMDAETTRGLTWQLEIEKFIDRIYGGMKAGEGHILNPFTDKLTLQTPIGLMSRFSDTIFVDVNSTQAAFDVTGSVIPLTNLNIIRTDDSAKILASTPMYGAHVFTDEFEHAILFNNKIADDETSATLFDQFLGIRIATAKLNFIRQDLMNKKPTFDGFFLSGNDIKRNIMSGAGSISNFYDNTKTFNDPDSARHALSLLGFTNKDYFTDLSINDTTQFNFWRGLVQAKGTNMSIDAFVNYKKFIDASVDEFWAYKVAEYGDAREKTFPEIKINPSDATQRFTKIQFYSSEDQSYDALPLYIQIENNDNNRWYSLDDLGTGMKFEAESLSEVVTVSSDEVFPKYIGLKNIYHNGDSFAPIITEQSGILSATVVNATTIKVVEPGTYRISGYTWINPSKLSPIKLFDYSENTLIDELGLWHPAIGIHVNSALTAVDMIVDKDPANYNYSTQITNNPNLNNLKPWADREVGRTWWDTSTIGYIPYYDSSIFANREAQHARWGVLAEWASINLYSWTASDVHPSEYDARAILEEGQSDIDNSVKYSGRVGRKEYYSRDRIISIRPIAWSKAGSSASSSPHPSFGPAEFTTVYAVGNVLIADTGRVEDINLVAGRHFGGWKNDKPVGEVVIGTDVLYVIGSADSITAQSTAGSGNILSITVQQTDDSFFGTRVGQITLKKISQGFGTVFLRMSDSDGFYEDIEMNEWFSDDTQPRSMLFVFTKFGLKLYVTRSAATTTAGQLISADQLTTDIVSCQFDVFVREAIKFETVISLPDSRFINNQVDGDGNIILDPDSYDLDIFEWRTWSVPTQAELNAELPEPRNIWKAYVGDSITIDASVAVIADMKSSSNTFTLRNGEIITRYVSEWSEWARLIDARYEIISDGVSNVVFTLQEAVNANRVSVYANGSQINPSRYQITNNVVSVLNLVDGEFLEGTKFLLLNRAYQPTAEELAFDPTVLDDVAKQEQFKLDYQYTQLDVRDSSGNIIGKKYYFWVEDKNIVSNGKNMSLVQARDLLEQGPSSFTVFSRMKLFETLPRSTVAFDSCAVAGLNRYVSKNDSFKLRFLRNFTLRDDPEQMNLKNVHTEWALIRRDQASKIPRGLWDKLTDAVSGIDGAGSPLPSKVRVDYDKNNGTNYRFGFKPGQIFADTSLVKATVINTILNTQLTLNLGSRTIIDFITALDFNDSDIWFSTPDKSRETMNLIWNTARNSQVNEIFFNVLDDALSGNYEFGDIFKTSLITVNTATAITAGTQTEQMDEQY